MEKSSCPGPTRIKLFLSVHSRGLSQRYAEYLSLEGALGSLGALSRIVVCWWALRLLCISVINSLSFHNIARVDYFDLRLIRRPQLVKGQTIYVRKEGGCNGSWTCGDRSSRPPELLPRLCYSWKDFGSVKMLLDYTKNVFVRGRSSAPARCTGAFLWKDIVWSLICETRGRGRLMKDDIPFMNQSPFWAFSLFVWRFGWTNPSARRAIWRVCSFSWSLSSIILIHPLALSLYSLSAGASVHRTLLIRILYLYSK